ncbi:IS1380 family transposase [Thioalkalicoccus limnaeus]|uniref:IS1380 family transposase n=1 Tax=Thioalkalicoccus limnaeus TaxID=120681 RepID=A0ABV4BG88_9GAMM
MRPRSRRCAAMPHATILLSYIALLCLGKSDFEAILGFREDPYSREAIGLDRVPSEAILRQRMDAHAAACRGAVEAAAIAFLRRSGARITPLDNSLVPLDCDVTPFDNSQSKKEGVSRTDKGEDGYAPMAAYLSQEGYCLELELRVGSQHCQNGTPEFLQRVIGPARPLSAAPLLLRLDSGNDAIENIAVVETHNEQDEEAAPIHYLIKWNPRRESPEKWLADAEVHGDWSEPRPGRRAALSEVRETRTHAGYDCSLRRVMRITKRTIDQRGQRLLVPEIEIEGWWTSLEYEEETIIALYADHGTSEQFHSEFESDLDIERRPSGKFATNALVLACALLAYNILRWIGRNGLLGPDAPPRHRAKRRRLRTLMQELMYRAARLIYTARQIKLAFGCPVVNVFRRLYTQLAGP